MPGQYLYEQRLLIGNGAVGAGPCGLLFLKSGLEAHCSQTWKQQCKLPTLGATTCLTHLKLKTLKWTFDASACSNLVDPHALQRCEISSPRKHEHPDLPPRATNLSCLLQATYGCRPLPHFSTWGKTTNVVSEHALDPNLEITQRKPQQALVGLGQRVAYKEPWLRWPFFCMSHASA